MKSYIRVLAALLVAVMAFTFVGCHKKNETVLTVDGVDIPSGLYMAFQLEAYSELITGVNEATAEKDEAEQPASYADYFNYEYEGKKGDVYVADRAKELIVEYVAIQNLFQEHQLEMTKEDTDYVDAYSEYYWEQSIKATYEPNGVNLATYKEVMLSEFRKSQLFQFYYGKKNEDTGKGGLKTVPDEDLIKKLGEDYILADVMTGSLLTTAEDGSSKLVSQTKQDEVKAKFDTYATKLNRGGKYAEIYKEYTGSEPQTTTTTTEEGPNSIYSATAGVYENDGSVLYETLSAQVKAKDFKYGTAYVLGGSKEQAYYLTMIYEIAKDPYYLEQYRPTLLQAIKGDEFDDFLAEQGKTLTVTANNSLVKYYKPTKIDFDSVYGTAQ